MCLRAAAAYVGEVCLPLGFLGDWVLPAPAALTRSQSQQVVPPEVSVYTPPSVRPSVCPCAVSLPACVSQCECGQYLPAPPPLPDQRRVFITPHCGPVFSGGMLTRLAQCLDGSVVLATTVNAGPGPDPALSETGRSAGPDS